MSQYLATCFLSLFYHIKVNYFVEVGWKETFGSTSIIKQLHFLCVRSFSDSNIKSTLRPLHPIQGALRKILKFNLISWCWNFVERHSFCRVSNKMIKMQLFNAGDSNKSCCLTNFYKILYFVMVKSDSKKLNKR